MLGVATSLNLLHLVTSLGSASIEFLNTKKGEEIISRLSEMVLLRSTRRRSAARRLVRKTEGKCRYLYVRSRYPLSCQYLSPSQQYDAI